MIKEEIIEINGKQFVKHTTDKVAYKIYMKDNKEEYREDIPCLLQVDTKIEYVDTIDLYPTNHIYEELDKVDIVIDLDK